jgi:hypothetical protein
LFKDVPSASAELDAYQTTRKEMTTAARLASLGVLTILAGYFKDRPPFDQNAITTGGYFVLGGFATALAGSAYTLGEYTANPAGKSDYLRQLAYVGALSLGLTLLGVAINDPPFGPNSKVGGYIVLAGLGFSVSTFAFHIGVRSAKDTHLDNAIRDFNQAHPDRPIELELKTNF